MNSPEILALQGQRIEGFVKIELIRKDGVKITEQHNMITPPGKQYLLNKSAGKMLDMNGQVLGSIVKQGVELNGHTSSGTSMRANSADYTRSLTNVVLSLSDEELAKINSSTNFINYFDEELVNASKVLGYANSALTPMLDGKEGTIEPIKGSEAVKANYITKKFKYADGVATGKITAIGMCPMTAITSPFGLINGSAAQDLNAPGFTISKCLDKVNPQYANFGNLSSQFLPPGITGFTSDTEVLYNYKQDDLSMHKIDLLTGEITDIEDEANFLTLRSIVNMDVYDYFVEDGYLYLLTFNKPNAVVHVYDLINKRVITTFSASMNSYVRNLKFLKYDGNVYITTASYQNSGNVIVKLNKGSSAYYSSSGELSTSYEGILTLPSGVNNYNVCFSNYGDNYIMYVGRNNGLSGEGGYYSTGYIFTDMSNIGGSIIDCIPSIFIFDYVFKNSSVGGILSIGKNKRAVDASESNYESSKYITSRDGTKLIDLRNDGLMYTPEKGWTNTLSIVKLDEPLIKNTNDVMYITYGYLIK